jgi:ribonuclease VapC
MADVVLDASAVLAFLFGETGGDVVAEALPDASMSAVNLAEVVARLTEKGLPMPAIRSQIDALPLTIHAADEGLAFRAGSLRAETRHLGLSLGDRFCLALGERLGLPILTADRAWGELARGFGIRVVR